MERISVILRALFIGVVSLSAVEPKPVDVGLIEQRVDGFYYLNKAKEPFEGVGVAYHEVGKDVRYRIREEWYAKGKLDDEKTENKQVALFKQAEAKLGVNHTVTVLTRKHLADYYFRTGHITKAIPLYRIFNKSTEHRLSLKSSREDSQLKLVGCLEFIEAQAEALSIIRSFEKNPALSNEFRFKALYETVQILCLTDINGKALRNEYKTYIGLTGLPPEKDPLYFYIEGIIADSSGNIELARNYFKKSIPGFEKMGISGKKYLSDVHECIGFTYLWWGNNPDLALQHQKIGVKINSTFLGPTHPLTAMRKLWLSWALMENGMLKECGETAEEVDRIFVEKLGANSSWRIWAWYYSGWQKYEFGDYAGAEKLFSMASLRAEQIFGKDDIDDYGWPTYGLINCLIKQGNYVKAEDLCRQLLALAEKEGATKIYYKSYFWTALIDSLTRQKKYGLGAKEAKSYLKEFGENQNNSTGAEIFTVDLAIALASYKKAPNKSIAIIEKYINTKKSKPVLRDVQAIRTLFILNYFINVNKKHILKDYYTLFSYFTQNILKFSSERERMVIFQEENPFSLACNFGDSNLIHTTLFRYKGLVLDSIVEDRKVLSQIKDPELSAQLKRLRNLKQMLASPSGDEDAIKSRMNVVKSLEDTVGGQLAKISAKYIQSRRAFTLKPAQVAERLGEGAVLLDYIRYDKYLDIDETEPHYGVVLLAKGIKPRWITLGKAEEIEKLVSQYNPFGQASDEDYEEVLFKLYKKLIEPVVKKLPPGTDRMIICPDGQLNFLNFGTLLNEEDGFVCEDYLIRYVASERDLLQEGKRDVPGKGLVVFANPAFGEEFAQADAPLAAMRAVEMNDLRAGVNLVPLPGTQKEADFLKEKAGGWKLSGEFYVGSQADEKQLSAVRSPRVLHLATHGFFLPESRGQKGLVKNPMHRSGLALAGAQKTLEMWGKGKAPPASNDGILTAAEVGMLDLKGTWLVVLSACETGRGEARSGEGVMGLRRGFIQAGTQNLLMTLWPVSDKQTIPFMKEFYEKAIAGGDAPTALAETQTERLVKLRDIVGTKLAVQLYGPFIMSFQGAE